MSQSLPEITGRPKAVERGSVLSDIVASVAGFGIIVLILGAFITPTMGATRSARLKWQERQRQMEEAEKRAAAKDGNLANPGAGVCHE